MACGDVVLLGPVFVHAPCRHEVGGVDGRWLSCFCGSVHGRARAAGFHGRGDRPQWADKSASSGARLPVCTPSRRCGSRGSPNPASLRDNSTSEGRGGASAGELQQANSATRTLLCGADACVRRRVQLLPDLGAARGRVPRARAKRDQAPGFNCV